MLKLYLFIRCISEMRMIYFSSLLRTRHSIFFSFIPVQHYFQRMGGTLGTSKWWSRASFSSWVGDLSLFSVLSDNKAIRVFQPRPVNLMSWIVCFIYISNKRNYLTCTLRSLSFGPRLPRHLVYTLIPILRSAESLRSLIWSTKVGTFLCTCIFLVYLAGWC